jgi:hypothetical protein
MVADNEQLAAVGINDWPLQNHSRRICIVRRNISIILGILVVLNTAFAVIYSICGRASVSVVFTHYGSHKDYTNFPCGFFIISNTGLRHVFFRGIGASSEF